MTDCKVICTDCQPTKTWQWLCEECAEQNRDQHRRHTGHQHIHLQVTREYTSRELSERLSRSIMHGGSLRRIGQLDGFHPGRPRRQQP